MPELRVQRFKDGRAYAIAQFPGDANARRFGRADTADGFAAAQREFDATLARWLANGRQFPKVVGDGTTIANVIDGYFAHQNRRLGDGWATKAGNGGRTVYALETLRGLYGTVAAAEFDLPRLEAVRDAMIATGKLCRQEINARCSAIRTAFKWAGRQKLAPRSIAAELEDLVPIEAGEFNTHDGTERVDVPFEHVLAVLPHLPPPFDTIVELLYRTGARPSEILGLRAGDIDQTDADQWVAVLGEHKTKRKGKARVLVFERMAQRALRPFLDRAPDAVLFDPAEWFGKRNELRRQKRGRKLYTGDVLRYERERAEREAEGRVRTFPPVYAQNELGKQVAKAIKRTNAARATDGTAPVPHWTPYRIRHAVCTEVEQRHGIELAATLLGHTSGRGVTDRYAHGVVASTKRASEAVRERPSLALLDDLVPSLPGRAPRLSAV